MPPRDHHGTDETEQPNTEGIDGYTLTKIESEKVSVEVIRHAVGTITESDVLLAAATAYTEDADKRLADRRKQTKK